MFTLYIIPEKYNGKTVLYLLTNHFALSKRLIKNLKFRGDILLNNAHVTVRKTVCTNDKLELVFEQSFSENIVPVPMNLDIIYEDSDILALNKPSGIATHPSMRHFDDTLANGVMHYFGSNFTFRAVTRLDLCTSGIVLIAKNAVSAQRLSNMLKNKQIKKTYLAVLSKIPSLKTGKISAPIKRCENSVIKRCISPDGKPAETIYEIVAENKPLCLAKLTPITGRTHQLRVHLAHIGAPIYSDFLYGIEKEDQNLCLHCSALEFLHPKTGRQITLNAPLRDDMKKLIYPVHSELLR